MQHGHPSVSTVHHHSALSAWKKLAQYVAQGAEAVEFPIAALLISDAVDFFVHLGRDRQGRRVVTEICEVAGWNGAEVQLNRIFVPGPDGRGLPQPHLTDLRRTSCASTASRTTCCSTPPGGGRRDARRRCSARCSAPGSASASCLAVAGWLGLSTGPADGAAAPRPAVDHARSSRGRAWPSSALALAGLVDAAGWPAMAAFGLLGWMAPSFVGLRARRRRQLARSEAIAVWAEMLRDLLVSNAGLHEAIGKSARVAPGGDPRRGAAPSTSGPSAATSSAALARFADDMDDADRRHRRHRPADRRPAGRVRPRLDARRRRHVDPRDGGDAAADQRRPAPAPTARRS